MAATPILQPQVVPWATIAWPAWAVRVVRHGKKPVVPTLIPQVHQLTLDEPFLPGAEPMEAELRILVVNPAAKPKAGELQELTRLPFDAETAYDEAQSTRTAGRENAGRHAGGSMEQNLAAGVGLHLPVSLSPSLSRSLSPFASLPPLAPLVLWPCLSFRRSEGLSRHLSFLSSCLSMVSIRCVWGLIYVFVLPLPSAETWAWRPCLFFGEVVAHFVVVGLAASIAFWRVAKDKKLVAHLLS